MISDRGRYLEQAVGALAIPGDVTSHIAPLGGGSIWKTCRAIPFDTSSYYYQLG